MTYKLLLSDDSITMQKLVELILAEEGFQIMSTSNGEEALEAVLSFKPDIILADVEMPKINGYQLCEKIKQDPSSSATPVILLAGAFEQFDEELAKKVGADDFIIKPFESQELIGKVHAALAISSSKKAESAEVPPPPEVKPEEDLWAMEEIPEIEEVAKQEPSKEKEEVAVKESVQPVTEDIAEAKVIEIEVPSKDELKEIFEKNVNSKIAEFLSSLNIREGIVNSYNDQIKEIINDLKIEMVNSQNLILKDNIDAVKESIINLYMPQLREGLDDIKENIINTSISQYKDSVEDIKEGIINLYAPQIKESIDDIKDSIEKIVSETVSNLAEGTIRESVKNTIESVLRDIQKEIIEIIPSLTEKILSNTLRNSIEPLMKDAQALISNLLPSIFENILRDNLKGIFESISRDIQNVIWKTVPDLAESIILKEIERIKSEF
ncbi:MAG: response regulator [Thermodesulfovibrionales bacterium]